MISTKSFSEPKRRFVQLHTLNHPRCAQAAGIPPNPPVNPDPVAKSCLVPNFVGPKYNPNSGIKTWNNDGGMISANWNGSKDVKGQTPSAGSSVACDSTLSLSQ
jgi:hypothetical protein